MPVYIWQIKLMLSSRMVFMVFVAFFFGFDNNLVTLYLTADWLLHIWNSFTAALLHIKEVEKDLYQAVQ